MHQKVTKLFSVLLFLAVITILSLTIGKQLFTGKQPSLASFFIVNFMAYLFFIMIPVEALVPYYLSQGHSGIVLILIAIPTAMAAQLLDYSTGYLASRNVIHNVIGEQKFQRAEQRIRNYGGIAIFLFNFLPLSSPILLLVAGIVRFNFRRAMLHSFLGLTLKYTIIIYAFNWFS